MTEPVETPKKKTGTGMRPWLKVVLFASLALNLAVAGLVIGAAVKYGPRDGHRPPRVDMMMGPYTHALSRKDRREIGEKLRREYRAERPSRQEMRAQFDRVLTALRAQPFDAGVVEQLFEHQLEAGMERQAIGQRLLMQRLIQMSDAERADFAERLEEGLKNRKPPRSGS
ncbi:MAG: periplasmic heavy metal sensor [Thalassovita sp.]